MSKTVQRCKRGKYIIAKTRKKVQFLDWGWGVRHKTRANTVKTTREN